jgi:RHS repeat-associated protein
MTTVGSASKATAFLGRNSRLGKKFQAPRCHHAQCHLRRNTPWASGKLAYESRRHRWIGESIDEDGDGEIDHQIRFAYDGNQIVLQFEKDGEGTVTCADLSHRYLWQPDAVDQLMADERTHLDGNGNIATDEVLWALTDRQGSVNDLAKRDATTGATAVVDHIVRDSFGKVISESNPAKGCLIGYTGRPIDKATGSQNNLNRWYDSRTAGWMSQDPKGFAAGQTNLYVYCGNSPTNATDPKGLEGGRDVHDYYDLRLTQKKINDWGVLAAVQMAQELIWKRAAGFKTGEAAFGTLKEAGMGGLAYITGIGIVNEWNPVGWICTGVGAVGFGVWGAVDFWRIHQIGVAAAEAIRLYTNPNALVP